MPPQTSEEFSPRWVPISKRLKNDPPYGRTRYYQLIGEGKIRAKKLGKITLVDLASEEAYIESLPDFGEAA